MATDYEHDRDNRANRKEYPSSRPLIHGFSIYVS